MAMPVKRLAALVAILALAPAAAGCGYNTIPTKEERARAAWADVEGAYQRRADLVPSLVATVQGAAVQERTVLTEVTEARARATSVNVTPETLNDPAAMAQFQAAQGELSQALSRLLLVVENYPQLQSSQNFLVLQQQLEGTENRINVSRNDYNEAVRAYNTELRTFPGVVWANTLHGSAEPMPLFEAAPGAEVAPTVNFDLGRAPATPPAQPAPAAPPQ